MYPCIFKPLFPPTLCSYITSPPIRSARDGQLLTHALMTGVLQNVATDHLVFSQQQKRGGEGDFRSIPIGFNGDHISPLFRIWAQGSVSRVQRSGSCYNFWSLPMCDLQLWTPYISSLLLIFHLYQSSPQPSPPSLTRNPHFLHPNITECHPYWLAS